MITLLQKPKAFLILMLAMITSMSFIRVTDFPESDPLWGVRNGLDTLSRGVMIFQPDEWNATTLGEAWSPNSWLWNVFLAVFYNMFGGVAGIVVLTFLTMFLTLFLIWRVLSKLDMPKAYQTGIVLISWVTLFLWMNGRANTVTALIVVLFLYLVLTLQRSALQTWRKYILLAVIAVSVTSLWVNLHLTAIIGLVLFPLMTLIVFSKGSGFWKSVSYAAVAGAATLLGVGLSPFGFEALAKISLVENESKDFFYEWSPLYAGGEINWFVATSILFALTVVGFLIRDILRKKDSRPVKIITVVALLMLSYATFDTIRMSTFLLIITLSGLTLLDYRNTPPTNSKVMILVAGVVGVITVAGVSLFALFLTNPSKAFHVTSEELGTIPQGSVILSTVEVSSGLILFRPDSLILVDGRNDLMGVERYVEAHDIMFTDDADELEAFLTTHEVDVVYVPARVTTPVRSFLSELGWEKASANSNGSETWIAP